MRTIRNWAREGNLRVYQVAGVHRIKSSDIDSLFESGLKVSDLVKIENEIEKMVGKMQ